MYPQQPSFGGPAYGGAVRVNQLGQFPQPVICPNCGQTHVTRTEYFAGTTTHIWALIIGILTCCCCIPYLIDGLKDVQHYCSNCNIPLARWHRNGGGAEVQAHERIPGQTPQQGPAGTPMQPMGTPMQAPMQGK